MPERATVRTVLLVAALSATASACMVGDAGPDEGTLDSSTALTGTIPGGAWRTQTFAVAQKSDLDAVLDWSKSSVNLNLFLYDPSGALVSYSNGSARPEHVSTAGAATGTWKIGIKNKSSSSTSYTLSLTVRPLAVAAAYPGQPPAGTVFWGAAISGNGDPVSRHETPAGCPLALHRTYWSWDKRTTSMVNQAKDDLAHHRLPWVSTKTPSWQEMADGLHDAEIDQMLRALDALGGPVWLTIHHEPEGGGGVNAPDDPAGPAGHVAMNRRVRERMTALGTRHIALAPILMSWSWTTASGRNPDLWWAPGIYDFLGVDHYRKTETALADSTFYQVRAWAAARSVDVAVGEWGVRGTDAAAGQLVQQWYDGAITSATDGKGARVVGLSAFDSNLNSPDGGWELMGAQLTTFEDLMCDPRTASIDDLP